MGRIQRGNIVIVNFEPVKDSEQGGIRPALVIQNNEGNLHSQNTIVLSITSNILRKNYPINVFLSKKESKLERDSVILCNQIRTIDKSRIKKRISQLDFHLMFQVDLTLKISLGLE